MTSFQEGEDDEDINTIVTPTAPTATYTGPITRARARQLNYQVLSFLGNDSNVHENMMLPKLDTFVLLTNEGPSLEKDEHWSKNKHGVDGMRKDAEHPTIIPMYTRAYAIGPKVNSLLSQSSLSTCKMMRTSIQLLHPQPLLLYILDQLLELVHAN